MTQPEPALVVAAQRFHAGESISPQELMDVFRAADVFFERLPELALPAVEYEGRWVPVFSTPQRLAGFVAARDDQPEGEAPFVCMPGARLLDVYIAHLTEPAGVVLDPLDAHMLLAPTAVSD